MKPFFRVIIPTYNAEHTLDRAIKSIEKQTFKDYLLVLVDDFSTDNTREIIKKYPDAYTIEQPQKGFNGGTRNFAVQNSPDSEYILFLDSDDEFINANVFQEIHDLIVESNYPDMVRLPYRKHYDNNHIEKDFDISSGSSGMEAVADVCWSKRVAPWTKALKSSVFVPFPENTLFEDVVQHIHQCDVISSVAFYSKPVVLWHIRDESTSHANSPKWQSSAYRFVADLMDLNLTHDYAKSRRDKKLRGARTGLLEGIARQ